MIQSKQQIRLLIKQKLSEWSKQEREQANQKIFSKLIELPVIQKAKNIGIYYSVRHEVDTINFFHYCFLHEKKIFLPRIDNQELIFYQITNLLKDIEKNHQFSIYEPKNNLMLIDKNELDIIIVPMVAFDKYHHRLGYGQGFYDRYLQGISSEKIIGLAYSIQEVSILPVEKHDQSIPLIITNI